MTTAAIAELRKPLVRPFLLIDIQFADVGMHIWTGIGPQLIGGISYVGMGTLLNISSVTETSDVQANGMTLSLSGVPSSLIPEAISQCRHGLPITLSFGFMTAAGVVIADPVKSFQGLMDSMTVNEGADTCTLSVTAESRISDLQRSRVRRFTDDDQQRTSPGDKGFQYVPMIQDWNLPWGKSKT